MKAILIAMLMLFSASVNALAQRDPDDPGIQDSVIIGTVQVDSGMTEVWVPMYITADDTLDFFNIPLAYHSLGGIYPDSIAFSDTSGRFDNSNYRIFNDSIRVIGWFVALDTTSNPRPFPREGRLHLLSIRFRIEPIAPVQIVTIDSTFDDRNGSVVFGLTDGTTEFTPGFGRSYIYYGAQTGIGDGDMTVPGGFSLLQNYPNPFNAQTTISYSLPESGPVTLSIYNLLGQKVATLVDGVQQTGEHRVVWNTERMGSGVYFARLETAGKAASERMVLLK